ncbi:MAG: dockerin type I domain-containing protein, partial [Candidatus Zixiibacteriota bacterium]
DTLVHSYDFDQYSGYKYPECIAIYDNGDLLIGDGVTQWSLGRVFKFVDDSLELFTNGTFLNTKEIMILQDSSVLLSDWQSISPNDGFLKKYTPDGSSYIDLYSGVDFYEMFMESEKIFIVAFNFRSSGNYDILEVFGGDTTVFYGNFQDKINQPYFADISFSKGIKFDYNLYGINHDSLFKIIDSDYDNIPDTVMSLGYMPSNAVGCNIVFDDKDNMYISEYVYNTVSNHYSTLYKISHKKQWYVSMTGDDILGDGSEENPFATIQHSINISSNSETVNVMPGTYEEIIDFLGKDICLKSQRGPDSTFITYPSRIDNLIRFTNNEDTNSVLDGFTIHDVSHNEGVIRIINASATVKNCVFLSNTNYKPSPTSWGVIAHSEDGFLIAENNYFENNHSYGSAGIGIACGKGRIENNLFYDNEAYGDYGGAIFVGGIWCRSSVLIRNNLFISNSAPHGGAIFLSENDSSVIRYNTFWDNSSVDGGGVCIWYYCSGIIVENNIIMGNDGYGITNQYGSTAILNYNNMYTNNPEEYLGELGFGSCSFSVDPLFCDVSSHNFMLAQNSVCLLENNDCGVLIGALGSGCETIYMCGDIDNSISINILDITYLIAYLYKDGPVPEFLESGDVNNSGNINILDITYLIAYLYKDGPAPVCP